MRTVKTPTIELFTQPSNDYVDIGLLEIISKEAFGDPLILKGPKGTGKTAAIEQYCAIHKIPFVRFDCNEWTNLRDLQGSMTAAEDAGYAFALGCATSAIETANESGKCFLILEEFNALTPNAQKILNAIADHRQSIQIPKIGKVFRVERQRLAEVTGKVVSVDKTGDCTYVIYDNETVQEIPSNIGVTVSIGDSVKAGDPITVEPKIWLVGTMNPNYGGTYQINEDMKSRFDFIEVPYMPRSEEQSVLLKTFGPKPTREQKTFIRNLQTVAIETRTTTPEGVTFGYALSPRDLLKTCRRFMKTEDIVYSLKVLAGKFDGDDRANFMTKVARTFEIDQTKFKGSLLYGTVKTDEELQES